MTVTSRGLPLTKLYNPPGHGGLPPRLLPPGARPVLQPAVRLAGLPWAATPAGVAAALAARLPSLRPLAGCSVEPAAGAGGVEAVVRLATLEDAVEVLLCHGDELLGGRVSTYFA